MRQSTSQCNFAAHKRQTPNTNNNNIKIRAETNLFEEPTAETVKAQPQGSAVTAAATAMKVMAAARCHTQYKW